MKLYHYTYADVVPSIIAQGLTPQADDIMSGGRAVVWLTKQPDTKVLSKQDAAELGLAFKFYQAPYADLGRFLAGEVAAIKASPPKRWWFGDVGCERRDMTLNGERCTVIFAGDNAESDLRRLIVEITAVDRWLHRYVDWGDRPFSPMHEQLYAMKHVRQWWVYLDVLPPSAIVAVEAID
jgi:hypothetical protein